LLIGSVNHFNCFLQHHWRTGLSERAEERTSGRFHLTIANRLWSIRADLHAELQFSVVSSGLPRFIRRGALPFTGLVLRFGFGGFFLDVMMRSLARILRKSHHPTLHYNESKRYRE
jgi:hypothetical protein